MPTNTLQPWEVLSSKTIHKTNWVELIEDTCLAADKQLTYTYSRRVDEGPVIIAEDQNQKLWLVRQYRHPIRKMVWQFPGEGMYQHEDWLMAAKRGLSEELHFQAQVWHDLGEFFVDPGGSSQRYHAYLATELSKTESFNLHQNEQEVENLETQSFSRKEIDDLIQTGELCDNWTFSSLFLYDRHRNSLLTNY